ncbi:DUF4102 domain-containing protein [Paracoccus aestuarii]|uniref:DUF4102 domain-containing protein n=1 Tax=Paracoccus aestuarii TaxID=453842 RepID=A0A418ZUF0_9RHOB|nr:integrase arm-type DNA-binding domain-containing protein [Paracoccus aestuarii]RJL02376.1 DUF4102 domain-containing protein [Paracoccus aestuarii]WCR00991.1 integrase arm-type DNA-binding domain-containing protein [Paracoccus aestuarii]
MSLTVKKLEAARFGIDKERLSDGNGLYVRLYPSGAKRFQVQVPRERGDKRRLWITLGDFPKLSLKEARETAAWIRLQVARDWSASRLRAALATSTFDADHASQDSAKPSKPAVLFREVAADWFERKRHGLKNGKHIAQNWTTIETYTFPRLADRPITEITKPEVVDTLRPIWHEKNETARRTLGRLQEIFELAELQSHITSNPARFNPQTAFGRVRRKTQHFGSLPWERMPDLWQWLVEVRCDEITRQFVMLLLLSAKRTGEVRFARHSWFSGPPLEVWETPAEYMKMGQSHRVPVSRHIATILDNMAILSGGDGYLFSKPHTKSGVISENAALNLLKRFDASITGHGARASFKGWARSQGCYQRDTIEFALAHGLPPLEAAYMREDLLEERRPMMQDWADFVTGGDSVPSLRLLGS